VDAEGNVDGSQRERSRGRISEYYCLLPSSSRYKEEIKRRRVYKK